MSSMNKHIAGVGGLQGVVIVPAAAEMEQSA